MTVVLRTVIAGAGTTGRNVLLFHVNLCTDTTRCVQRLFKRCSVVKFLNISVRELVFEGQREMQNEVDILQFLHLSGPWETWSLGDVLHSSGVESIPIPLFWRLATKC